MTDSLLNLRLQAESTIVNRDLILWAHDEIGRLRAALRTVDFERPIWEWEEEAKAAINAVLNGYVPAATLHATVEAERERCALIVEQSAGFPTHKLRRKVAAAIRNPATFYKLTDRPPSP